MPPQLFSDINDQSFKFTEVLAWLISGLFYFKKLSSEQKFSVCGRCRIDQVQAGPRVSGNFRKIVFQAAKMTAGQFSVQSVIGFP
jgi:hypothetical protein